MPFQHMSLKVGCLSGLKFAVAVRAMKRLEINVDGAVTTKSIVVSTLPSTEFTLVGSLS